MLKCGHQTAIIFGWILPLYNLKGEKTYKSFIIKNKHMNHPCNMITQISMLIWVLHTTFKNQ